MDRMQRMSLISLSLVVVLAMGLSLKSFGARLKAPFGLKPAAPQQDASQLEAQSLLRLKITDTDKDGLSDYDELYLYKTSPYIPDSDSDGYPDEEEVRTGNDPNCPKGNDCSTGITDPGVSVGVQNTAPTATAVNPYTLTDPKQIREVIASTGMISAAELDQIDDATLLQLWGQVKNTVTAPEGIPAVTTPAVEPSATSADKTKLPVNPPVADVRSLLLKSGVSQDVLNTIDDATLMKLYEETRLEQESKPSTGN